MKESMTKMFHRFLALLLCAAMLLPIIPASVFVHAAEENSGGINQITESELEKIRDLYPGGTMSNTMEYDCGNGVSRGGEKSYLTMVTETTATHFGNFKTKLASTGYVLKSENTVPSKDGANNLFAGYVSPDGSYKLYTYFFPDVGEARIIVDTNKDTVEGYVYEPQTGVTVEPKMVLWGLSMSEYGYDIGEVMSEDQDKQRNCGALLLMRMPDNSLFIYDGGDLTQMSDAACDNLLAFCRELTGTADGEKMVINTWFLSHGHSDHFRGFTRFLNKNHEHFDLKNMVYNIDNERTGVVWDISDAMKMVCTHYPEVRYYKPHTGEKFNVAGVEFEVVYAQEDRYLPNSSNQLITDENNYNGTYRTSMYSDADTLKSNFNDTSMVLRTTFTNGISSLLYGDLVHSEFLQEIYPDSVLKADIMSVPHHSNEDQSALVTAADAKVYLQFQRKEAIYGPDGDVSKADLYTTYHHTRWERFLKMFPGMNVSKDTTPNVDYDIFWAGTNTTLIDINALGRVVQNGSAETYYDDSRETEQFDYTGWEMFDLEDEIDESDRLLGKGGAPITATDKVLNATYAFRYEKVTSGTLNAFGYYVIMHKDTQNIMSYNPVALTPGRPNQATSLHRLESSQVQGAGTDVYYEDTANNRVYFEHSNLPLATWIFRQKDIKVGSPAMTKATRNASFGGSAYDSTWLAKATQGDATNLVDGSPAYYFWNSVKNQDDNTPVTQYRYLNQQYNTSKMFQTSEVGGTAGYLIEDLGSGEFVIYWRSSDKKTMCFLTCDENGIWGIKKYTNDTTDNYPSIPSKSSTEFDSLKLHIYSFKTWRNTSNLKKVNYSIANTVYNVEQGTTLEQLMTYLQSDIVVQDGSNRNYFDIPCSGVTPKVGSWYLKFEEVDFDSSGKGYNQYHVTVMYREGEDTDTELGSLTVNVLERNLEFAGKSSYEYNTGVTEAEVLADIQSKITVTNVFSLLGTEQSREEVSFGTTAQAGKYWLESVQKIDSNAEGVYFVNVNYRRTNGTDILVKTLTVYVGETIESYEQPTSNSGWVMVNSTLGVVVKDSEGNPVTVKINGTDRDVTLGMLTKDELPVDVSSMTTYSDLTLTYGGQVICENFTLEVISSDDERANYPIQGEPGYVGVDKAGTTSQTEFNTSGVANIQLSATGIPTEKGIDLIVVMDLSGSMLYGMDINDDAADYKDSRVVAMQESLKDMIKTLQESGADVRIAMSDFGDLDHYYLEGAVADSSILGYPEFDVDFDNHKYSNPYEFSNHLNYIFSPSDYTTNGQITDTPFGVHRYKWDYAPTNYTGVVTPYIYTGSGEVNANAFVDVDSLYDGVNFTASMDSIIRDLDENVQKVIGTNYDVGLEYAYHLGYSIQQDNIQKGKDREIVCIFMSDGAPMQYNYFSGGSSSQAWDDWIGANVTSINSLSYSADNWPAGLSDLAEQLLTKLKAGTLVRPEYQRGPWEEQAIYDEAIRNDNYTLALDAAQGYFLYRERYEKETQETLYDYLNGMRYYLDWDYLSQIALANGIENFSLEYYKNDRKLSELLDLFLDKEFIGYERDGSNNFYKVYRTKLKNPSLLVQQNYVKCSNYTGDDFFEAMKSIGIDCTWDLFAKIAYKNLGEEAMIEFTESIRTQTDGSQYNTLSPYAHFYNQDNNKNWWAEAIKGDVNSLYPVINKYAYADPSEQLFAYNGDVAQDYNGLKYMSGFRGLGIDIYSISFSLADDKLLSVETTQNVLKKISSNSGSTGNYFFAASSQDELTSALTSIVSSMSSGATKAYFTDTMGEDYDLYYGQVAGIDEVPSIKVMEYTMVDGKRTGTPNVRETITFANNNGVFEAYSDQVYTMSTVNGVNTKVFSNIWDQSTGLIKGSYVIYNTNKSESVNLYLDDTGRKFPLQPETFFWIIGNLGQTEVVLEYQVYLTNTYDGNEEDRRGEGLYDTNENATLYYVNYLGNNCSLEAITPSYAWGQGRVGVAFYLVDAKGKPIVNATTGATGTFENAVRITGVKYQELKLNSSETIAALASVGVLPKDYELFSTTASYQVTANAGGNGSWTIGDNTNTTYVVAGGNSYNTNQGWTDGTAADTVVWFAVRVASLGAPDTIVIDYGLPVDVNVLANDKFTKDNIQKILVGEVPDTMVEASQQKPVGFGTSVTGKYGTLVVNDNQTLRYTLNSMTMDAYDAFCYVIEYKIDDQIWYYYAKLTILPATTIYFEDDFKVDNQNYIRYEGEVTGNAVAPGSFWNPDGSQVTNQVQDMDRVTFTDEDLKTIYGYDSHYKGQNKYSMGTAMKTTVYANEDAMGNITGQQITTATFQFTGTGFDVVSMTSNRTGLILVRVYPYADGKRADEAVWTGMVDTYYGYTYDAADGKWSVTDSDDDNAIYQIPVINVMDLTHGTYEAEIYVAYQSWFAQQHAPYMENGVAVPKYDFYLDGIRVYNPASNAVDGADTTIQDAYVSTGEGWPIFNELRDLLMPVDEVNALLEDIADLQAELKKENADTATLTAQLQEKQAQLKTLLDGEIAGAMFIDGMSGQMNVQNYANYGPNNEVYIKNTQAVHFTITSGGIIDRVYLGLKATGGNATVKITDTSDNVLKTIELDTTADMYYDITGLGSIIITNESTSGAIVSITNLKTTYTSNPYAAGGTSLEGAITVDGDELQKALMLLNDENEMPEAPIVEIPTLELDHPSLSFEEEIKYNIYFNASNIDDVVEFGLALFSERLSDGTVENALQIIPGYVTDGTIYMASTNGIPARNMGDTVYFKVYAKLSDGSYVYSDVAGFSAVAYAKSILKNNGKSAALVVALMNYGAAAQEYFGETGELMNSFLTAEQQALVLPYDQITIADAIKADESKVGGFAKTAGWLGGRISVSFESTFVMNYYFSPEYAVEGEMKLYYWDAATYESADVLTVDNASGCIVMTDNGSGVYMASYTDIAAKQIEDTLYVAAVYENGGNTYATGVIGYSLAAYCKQIAGNDDSAMQDLAKATAVYGSYAKEYFGK